MGNRHRVERQPSSNDLNSVLVELSSILELGSIEMSVEPYHEATFQKHCISRLGDRHCHVLITSKMGARDQVTRDQMARVPMARD